MFEFFIVPLKVVFILSLLSLWKGEKLTLDRRHSYDGFRIRTTINSSLRN